MSRRLGSLALLLAAILGSGCGEDDANGGRPSSPPSQAAERPGAGAAEETKAKGRLVKVVNSDYGRVVADAKGEAFYLFNKEDTRRAECYGACAAAWPPVLTKGRPRAGKGARQRLLGTTRRRDGRRQVTYAGHPLYYYVDDTPGNILCHDVDEFGGLWLVVKPSGRPVG